MKACTYVCMYVCVYAWRDHADWSNCVISECDLIQIKNLGSPAKLSRNTTTDIDPSTNTNIEKITKDNDGNLHIN